MRADLKRINTRHRALMRDMVIHPNRPDNEHAKNHGFHPNNIGILKNSELFMDAMHLLQDDLDEKELKDKAVRDGIVKDPVRRTAVENSKLAIDGIVLDMDSPDERIAHAAKLDVLKIAGYDVNKPTETKITNTNINISADAAKQMKLSREALATASEKYKKRV